MKNTTFIQLNEIDFDAVQIYLDRGESLPTFELMISRLKRTSSEIEYDDLEPWIQWPSVYTGLTAREHNIFRLGDCVSSKYKQIFELLEEGGLSVGAVCPMNARNDLKAPAFFLPDPWTNTDSDKSLFTSMLTRALRQVVNDNAGNRIRLSSYLIIAIGVVVGVRFGLKLRVLDMMTKVRSKPWYKALILDQLLAGWHEQLIKWRRPDFTSIFFNAGAHIQHHYFLNSRVLEGEFVGNPEWYVPKDQDPVLDMLKAYDLIISDELATGRDVIIATGLSQRPCKKPTFYYRLSDHENFLRVLGITGATVSPRMTRDFLVSFESENKARAAGDILKLLRDADDLPYFGVIENRGSQLFCTFTYPLEIREQVIRVDGQEIRLRDHVDFVAIKNGEHSGIGYLYSSTGVRSDFKELGHVKNLQKLILEHHGIAKIGF